MSTSTTFIWTPVASGITPSGTLQVTLVITPQVSTVGDDTLSNVPDLANGAWCATVSAMNFGATFEVPGSPGGRVQGPAKRVSPDPDRAMFQTMFPDSTKVVSYAADDYSQSKIRSADVAGLSSAMDRLQEQVFAGSSAVRPEISALLAGPLAGYDVDEGTYDQISRAVNEELAAQKYTSNPDTSTPSGVQTAIVMMRQMVEPLDTEANVPGMLDPGYVVPWPEWEFHEKFSVLDSHPQLLRKIGFIIDIDIDPSDMRDSAGNPVPIPTGTGGVVEVRINPFYTPDPSTTDIPQGTVATLDKSTPLFLPRFSGTGPIAPGFVDINLDGKEWPVVTSEIGSETMAAATLATGAQRAEAEGLRTPASPKRAGTPARASVGMSLVQPQFARRTHGELDRQWNIAQSIDPAARTIQIANAEDLVVGYQLDVRPSGLGPWLSLNLRNGIWRPDPDTYGAGTVDLGPDEGWTEPGGASATGSTANEYRYMPVVSAWTGWSQSIERPGKSIDPDSEAAAINPLSPPPPGFGATIDYVAPPGGAQLPTLRFGTTYQLRLRQVFLGGYSRKLTDVEPRSARIEKTYLRHEPVMSPVVYLGDIKGEIVEIGDIKGESVTLGGEDGYPCAWMQSSEIAVVRSLGGGAAVDPSQTAVRWLTPTRVSPWLVEQHGLLDDASGKPDPAKYSQIAARDAAFYGSSTPGYVAYGDVIGFDWASPADGTTAYYPDPLTSGVLLRGVPTPSGGATETRASFGGSWPSLVPLELSVGGTGTPGATVSGQTIDLQVAPGRTQILRTSSSIPSADLNLLDLWERVKSTASATDAAKGAYWQLSPYREITVVHATKRPVSAPYFAGGDTWTTDRAEGEIQCRIGGTMTIDEPSTESVSLTGTLVSGIDGGPGTPAPEVKDVTVGDIGSLNVANPAPGGPTGSTPYAMEATVQLPDTRRYNLALEGTAYSRYAEYFRQLRATTHTAGSTTAIVVLPDASGVAQVLVPGSARVQWSSGGEVITGTPGVDFTENAALGTISPIASGAMPTGTIVLSAIADPVTLSTTQSTTGATSRTFTLPASARPQPPEVAASLPAFSWNAASTATTSSGRVTSTRSSASIRVYLERPWFSSGINEDLAVLVRPRRNGGAVSDYVSRWGGDPTVTGGGKLPSAWPKAPQFTNRQMAMEGIRLAEDPSLKVAAVVYHIGREAADGSLIGWDADRDQWYVDLDIDIDDAYKPFIRLALARYQAGAPDRLQLSPVTLLDVVQLDPSRTATVSVRRAVRSGFVATVGLSGPSYKANALGGGPGTAYVIHERLSDDAKPGDDAVLWQEVSRQKLTGRYSSNEGTWSGQIDLGSSIGGGRHRLVIEQYEEWQTDGRVLSRGASTGLRLVHQDIIALG